MWPMARKGIAMPKVQTYVNKKGQTVAQDAYGSWKVYNPNTKKFGAYAEGPEIESNGPAPPGIDPEAAQLVEQLGNTEKLEQQAELDRLGVEVERLQRVIVEKDTTISDKAREVGDRDAVIASRDATIRGLHQELETEKIMPRADPGKIEELKREIARLTAAHDDALKEKQNASPVYRERFYERWWKERPGWTLGVGAVVALLLFILLLSGVKAWTWGWKSSPQAVVTTVEKPDDYDSVRSRLADVEAKQAAKEKADAALADRLKKMPSLVPLQSFDSK